MNTNVEGGRRAEPGARRPRGAPGSIMAVAVIAALFLVSAGCNQKRTIQPVLPKLATGVPQRPTSLGLYIDQKILQYVYRTKTQIDDLGWWKMTLTYELGEPLREVIENTAKTQFRDVTRVDEERCPPGAEDLVLVSFAREPSIDSKWERGIWKVGGVTTAEFALNVVARNCKTNTQSKHVVVGYGSEIRKGAMNWPGKGDFRPGMDAALADLAQNLDKTLGKITFAGGKP